MKVLIWPGHHDVMDYGIKFLTHGAGTHVALLRASSNQEEHLRLARAAQRENELMEAARHLAGMEVHESFYPCVRTRPFTLEDLAVVEIYDVEGVTPEQHEHFERLFSQHDGFRHQIRYSIGDLFRYAFNCPAREATDRSEELHGMFCSRYAMFCFRKVLSGAQLPLVRLPARDWASPRDLRISPRLWAFRWSGREGVQTPVLRAVEGKHGKNGDSLKAELQP